MIPEIDFTDPATVRLISTAYIDEPAVTPLCDNEDEIEILNRLEAQTSARLSPVALPSGVSPAELLNESFGYGWSLVNAAFCHARPPGNRFNGEERGAWYCAFGALASETCQAEIIFHRTRALRDAGNFNDIGHYRELIAGFLCRFHDVRGEKGAAYLDPDPAIAYPAGQALAGTIIAKGGNGVIYPSARHPAGECLAVFRPSVIQNIRQGRTISFEWTGSPVPRVLGDAPS
ncbi:RES family NAD+ phosphorylase [Ensifer sp. IC4062]|nr:RES family NAD+ phosphorylase [Ensifer sp. IC4062]